MLKLVVTDGERFFSDETDDGTHDVRTAAPEIPLQLITSTFGHGRYRLEKEVVCDPQMDVVYMRVRFVPLRDAGSLRVFAYLVAYPFEAGANADVVDCKGRRVLTASSEGAGIALAASAPFTQCSVGFVGTSDGMADLHKKKRLTHEYTEARGGHVGLTGEIDRAACHDEWTFALAFGGDAVEAAQYAHAALDRGFEQAREGYAAQWSAWHRTLRDVVGERDPKLVRTSATILKTLRDKRFPGGSMAALATPWGSTRAENADGTYHLVWTRDLVECATALLALGRREEPLEALSFLRATQEVDGHWPQNMTLAGEARWNTTELDELALPILLTSLLERERVLDEMGLAATWPMVRKAAAYIARFGAATLADRWEDEHGYTPFTLATEIAALLVAARYADANAEPALGLYFRETADAWNDSIERWLWRSDPAVCERFGVRGYYARAWDRQRTKRTKYQRRAEGPAGISPDVLALVRFGLRAADDPRITDTLRVVDPLLRVDVDGASTWRRYTGDAYGESKDGEPFHDGHGEGHGWPLLTGERAHYELLAGRRSEATRLARAMEALATREHLIGEQTWEGPDLPKHGLVHGAPTNSATPLGWAHGEYLLLCRALLDGQPFDRPRETVLRYLEQKTRSAFAVWRPTDPRSEIDRGAVLRIELFEPGAVKVKVADRTLDIATRDTGVGVHVADVGATADLPASARVSFRFHPAGRRVLLPKRFDVEVGK